LLQAGCESFYGEITPEHSVPKRSSESVASTLSQYTGVSQKRDPVGDSIYHALTAKLDKRFFARYSLLASYTWSKLIDDVQERFGGRSYISDPTNLSTSRALGDFDATTLFSLAHVVDLPFGPSGNFCSVGQYHGVGWMAVEWCSASSERFPNQPLRQMYPMSPASPPMPTSCTVAGRQRLRRHAMPVRYLGFQIPAPFTLGTDSRNEPDIVRA